MLTQGCALWARQQFQKYTAWDKSIAGTNILLHGIKGKAFCDHWKPNRATMWNAVNCMLLYNGIRLILGNTRAPVTFIIMLPKDMSRTFCLPSAVFHCFRCLPRLPCLHFLHCLLRLPGISMVHHVYICIPCPLCLPTSWSPSYHSSPSDDWA